MAVLEWFKNKKVLITGGTGLVGRQLLDILAPIAKTVYSVSLDDLKPVEGVVYYKADLREYQECKNIIEDKDIVLNCIGIKGNPDVTGKCALTMLEPYLQFNTNILRACRENNVDTTVFVSTIGAYSPGVFLSEQDICEGQPMDRYAGHAKRMGELWIEAYKKEYKSANKFIAVRPANIYGPGDNFDPENAMVIPSLMMKILRGDNPVSIWGNGSAARDFVFSKDVALGILQAAYYCPDVPYLNLGSGYGTSIEELIIYLKTITKFTHEYDTSKPNGFPQRVMSISLARRLINYNPTTSLYSGLKQTWDWFVTNKDEYLKRQNYFK
jgi:GDP-L-fucose synthase